MIDYERTDGQKEERKEGRKEGRKGGRKELVSALGVVSLVQKKYLERKSRRKIISGHEP